MRPALQRLLERPSSIELLRCLVGTSVMGGGGIGHKNLKLRFSRHNQDQRAQYSSNAISSGLDLLRGLPSLARKVDSPLLEGASSLRPRYFLTEPPPLSLSARTENPRQLDEIYGPWWTLRWTHEELEALSNLDSLDHKSLFANSIRIRACKTNFTPSKLRAYLLDFRERNHGSAGIQMFFRYFRDGKADLPMRGLVASKFWQSFLSLGFQDEQVLEEVVQFGIRTLTGAGHRYAQLYVKIIAHFLANGESGRAHYWHRKLFGICPPDPRDFHDLARYVVRKEVDLNAFKDIHKSNFVRSSKCGIYAETVPYFCKKQDFENAWRWHHYLLNRGDLPATSDMVQPLLRFLTTYQSKDAAILTKSLHEANVPFATDLSEEIEKSTKISREMMNLLHGEHMHIRPIGYNDDLGARWFATKWVSIDVAINSIHALGVREIGPLSLQSIALREFENSAGGNQLSDATKALVVRITQLQDLGVSLGGSLYAKALERFARRRQFDYFEGLITSDQHPHELENADLQEALMTAYARAGDWAGYKRTLEIQALASKYPATEEENLVLRMLIRQGDISAITDQINHMSKKREPVLTKTVGFMLRQTLMQRRRGHCPTGSASYRSLLRATYLLKVIMQSGHYVPITQWREILRRYGMMRKFSELSFHCRFLAQWYKDETVHPVICYSHFRVPPQVPTSHVLHPLRILFCDNMQKNIVTWGFLSYLTRTPRRSPFHQKRKSTVSVEGKIRQIVKGIALLKELNAMGVYINTTAVKTAIIQRLVTYFGPGYSNRIHNRIGRDKLAGRLDEVAGWIDQSLGGEFFTGVELSKLVEQRGTVSWGRVSRKQRRLVARGVFKTRDPELRATLGLREERDDSQMNPGW